MTVGASSSTIGATSALSPTLVADLVIVPWFEDDAAAAVSGIDDAAGGEVARALASREFSARLYDVFVTAITHASWRARRLALIGAGRRDAFGTDVARRLATAAALWTKQHRVRHAALVVRSHTGGAPTGNAVQAVAEGLTLAEFDAGRYKTREHDELVDTRWTIAMETEADGAVGIADACVRGRVLGECSNLARELANEPGNTLTPRELAARTSAIAGEVGVRVDVLDEDEIARLNMGLLLGVARGSSEPPRLIVFRYEPAGAPAAPVLGLVGKGITFDTGGISIKPADGMDRMKDDMTGGAAVACAMRAIALLKAPMRVIGVVPATENMPGGRAVKPGDVLTSASGKTVEVLNTDAEGRLVLGDGLWYARQLGATHLVDVATLTGAVVVALGRVTSGLFGTPVSWVERVRRVADRAGDRAWPMPLFDDYREQLKSEIADFTNTGGRPAGSITAALFLSEFTGGLPWVHMDIAGTAWAEESKPYLPKGPTGVAVRTLAELAFERFDETP
jgi:leucyl aminopeptidase